ncbi:MAG: DUF1993 domain-containing protein [Roseiarcus sp.]|jgi:hypothetical protein
MSLSLYQSSVPVFERSLNAFIAILDKAAAHAAACKFDPAIYLTMRLRPDMFAFARQTQAFCDHAKNGAARLAGVEAPKFEDKEASLDELRARIKKTLDFLAGLDAKAIDAASEREIVFPSGPNKAKMLGANYLVHYALPNFYFHLTTAYDILRYAGVPVGKRDFMGAVPGFTLI